MDTEIREWFNDIWAYCEENWVAVAAVAAVVLLVLLSIVLVCSAKREDRKALKEMAEAESESALEPDSNPEEPAEEPAIAELAEPVAEESAEAPEEPAGEAEAETAEKTVAETAEEPVEAAAEETVLQESAMGMVDSLVKSMESVAGASGQKVESIELKIEKAQLTIHYAGGEKKTVSEGLLTEQPVSEAVTAAAEWEDIAETETEPEITYFAENAGRAKRFGFDNMNTARSGRVYTEEELLNQIRD